MQPPDKTATRVDDEPLSREEQLAIERGKNMLASMPPDEAEMLLRALAEPIDAPNSCDPVDSEAVLRWLETGEGDPWAGLLGGSQAFATRSTAWASAPTRRARRLWPRRFAPSRTRRPYRGGRIPR